MHGMVTGLIYAAVGLTVLTLIIVRQVRERRLTVRGLVGLPAAFVVLAFVLDHTAAHRLADPLALALLAVGIVAGVGFGVARGATMRVRREGAVLVTKGTRATLVMWLATIAVRIGVAALSYRLGVPEGTTEAFLFAAATFGAQNVVLARRGGFLPGRVVEPVTEAPVFAPERVG
jgi:hypothetical protein